MQENTSRTGLPAWIFFILAMIAVIGFVVFQQNRPSDMPPEASVQPPEQPVNKAIETVKDLAVKAVEIADPSKISAEDADETPQETESALENGASAKAETVAEAPQAVADRDGSVDQKQAEAANDSPTDLTPAQSKAEIAAEETRATESTKAPAAAEEEGEIVVEDAAAGGEAEALQPTGAAEAETDMSKTAAADAEAEPENLQKQPAADVANQAEAPATQPAAEDVDATVSAQTREETTQAATEEAADLPAKEKKTLARMPQIETIRIEADGAVLIAGLVGPNQAVDVLVNDVALLTLYADGSGNFAGFFDLPYSSELRVIRLRVGTAESYVFSDQDVLVLPTQIAAPLPEASETSDEAEIELAENAEATSEATASEQSRANETSQGGLDASGLSAKSSSVSVAGDEDSDNQSASEGETTESARADLESPKVPKPADAAAAKAAETPKIADAKPEETASAQPPSEAPVKSLADAAAPPKVLIADKDGVRVVQSDDSLDQDAIALDAISYDEDGQVMLSGRSNPMAYLRIYLDNAPVLLVRPDDDGNWKTLLSNVDPGVYTLRIDQVNAAGKVVSRLETPFKKESPQKLLTHLQDTKTEARINVVTVQPGYTLWAIARKRYGRGILYVRVFEANRDKIRDPDLIYPGQVFDLPD
ncbi:MAG: LysM peptidoglycan-binding domain-containing protein [Rhodobacteraceae bacterium]|nr:LysM peptidoglycan-binding domain-containing protein [Paracoccaceae bacterium]MBL6639048.1 LysM peptidoglycan-binding domain-containing protein [Paracoccaceae bacterium]MBL6788146.1 LysM peptidoglycan-binding domain-containing protein [Paracoccaceae bacterium]MBL6858483.1 LysM peptidoglycan-binding domain-containing protein [Paracoccaceae bacterium]